MVLEIAETAEGVARESVAGTNAILASGAMAVAFSTRTDLQNTSSVAFILITAVGMAGTVALAAVATAEAEAGALAILSWHHRHRLRRWVACLAHTDIMVHQFQHQLQLACLATGSHPIWQLLTP